MAFFTKIKGRKAGTYVVTKGPLATEAARTLAQRFRLSFQGDNKRTNGRVGPLTDEQAQAFAQAVEVRCGQPNQVKVDKLRALPAGYLIVFHPEERLRALAVARTHGIRILSRRIGPVPTLEEALQIIYEIKSHDPSD